MITSQNLFLQNLFTQEALIALLFCAIAFCVSFVSMFLLIRFGKNYTLFKRLAHFPHAKDFADFAYDSSTNPPTESKGDDSKNADFAKVDSMKIDSASAYATRESSKDSREIMPNAIKIGGLGIILGVLAVFLIAEGQSSLLFYMFGGLIVFFSGFIKDMGLALSPKICLLLKAFGVFLSLDIWLKSLGLGFELPYAWVLFLSIVVVVGFCNAMSVVDKFNGLSGGYSLCVCLSMISVAISVDMFSVAMISAVLGSAVLGFLVLNFPNGRVLLGSGGAYFLGFGIAMILVILTQTSYSIVSPFYGICVMIYPLWEMIFIFFREKILEKKDSVYFHTLLFKRLGNNPLTSLIILCAQIPFIALPTLFYADTFALLITCLVFIIAYIIVYNRLINAQDK